MCRRLQKQSDKQPVIYCFSIRVRVQASQLFTVFAQSRGFSFKSGVVAVGQSYLARFMMGLRSRLELQETVLHLMFLHMLHLPSYKN